MEKTPGSTKSVLAPVSEEEFEKLETPSVQEMQRALDEGRDARDAMQASAQSAVLVSHLLFR